MDSFERLLRRSGVSADRGLRPLPSRRSDLDQAAAVGLQAHRRGACSARARSAGHGHGRNAEHTPDERRGRLAFPSGSFDLITNRHEKFLPREVARVLTPGGTFLTQQTGGNYDEFYDALTLPRPERSSREWTLALATEQLRPGLQILKGAEDEEETTFAEIGALAWYLRAIPGSLRASRPRAIIRTFGGSTSASRPRGRSPSASPRSGST